MNSWKIILSTLLIFGAGVVTGGLLVSHAVNSRVRQPKPIGQPGAVTTPWHAQSKDLLRRMERELSLTQAQRDRIEAIILDSQERTRSLWKPIAPQMIHEMKDVRDRIREQLTSDQQARYDDLIKPRQPRKIPEEPTKDMRPRPQRRTSLTNFPPVEGFPTNGAPDHRPL